MFTVVANSEQLRKALKDIERAEKNGFMHCQAVFHLISYGASISDCLIEFDDLIEKADPTNPRLNWGRGQAVTKRNRFENGKLTPIGKTDQDLIA